MITDSIAATQQFLTLLQEQVDSQPDAQVLIEALQPLVDLYSETGLLGMADGMALFAEQLEQLESLEVAEQKVLLIDFSKALQDLISQPGAGIWQYLLACLSDSHWPEPLAEEDCEFLAELLEQDCKTLTASCVATEPDAELPGKVLSLSPGSPYLETAVDLLNAGQDEAVGQLYELVDLASEGEQTGFADLFALLAEIWENEADTSTLPALHAYLIDFLTTPDETKAAGLLQLMAEPRWQAPLPEEDRSFLEEILVQDIVTLAQSSAIEADTRNDVVTPEEVTPVVAVPSPPAFCDIDLSLLEQPAPELDPAVLEMLQTSLAELHILWQAETSDSENLYQTSLALLEPVQRAMQSLHLLGAGHIVQGLQNNVNWLQQYSQQLQHRNRLQLAELIGLLISYLADISNPQQQQALLDLLEVIELPTPVTEEQISYLAGLMALVQLQGPESLIQEQAQAEDVRLDVADDIDPQLLDMLFNELPALSETLTEQLQGGQGQNQENLREAQRAAHTIKGLANMAGITGIANLTHRLEDILELFTEADQLPGSSLSEDLIAITDAIAMMCEAVVAQNPAPEGARGTLQLVMDWHFRLRSEGLQAQVPEIQQQVQDVAADTVKPLAVATDQVMFRVPEQTLDSLLRLAGESTTLNTQLDEEMNRLRSYTRISRDRQRALQRVLFELEQQLNEHYTLQPQLDEAGDNFDPLEMDRYNEMHTSLSRLQEAAADIQEVDQSMDNHIRRAGELHLAQSGIQKENLEQVLSTRLVEVKSISSRLQRALRQACRSTGKQAELHIEGEQTRIDSHILNQLADPLMHMIRNAVDHGLEMPEDRRACGKDETGRITLRFWLENDLIRVTCNDNGAGINTTQVRKAAEQKGLIEADAVLDQRDIERLILIPGFSTREEVSQLSGRGIGMDVVHQQVMRLQGVLDISSEQGKGTTLEISMPSSSLMIKTLLVRAGRQIYALASHGLEQSLISLDGQLQDTETGMTFLYDGEHYPAYALEPLLGEHGSPYETGQVHPVLLVNLGQGERVAVMVREVIAHRELAFKEMGDYLPDIPGIPGLTILANGDTAAVIDLPARIRYKSASEQNLFKPALLDKGLELPRLLVVDDSLSARSSLSTLLRDTGYEVNTAIDGLDAMNQIRKSPPDLVLTDLEMPRMTGMELTSMIRGRDEMRDIPVLMITSRTTERHRQEAETAGVSSFVTKPWTENMLLDQVKNLLQPGVSLS